MMIKATILILMCSVAGLLIYKLLVDEMDRSVQRGADPKLNLPLSPHGLPYRVGNLGGKPVLLGEGISFVEYEDSPLIVRENRRKDYEPPLRNFDSVITSFGAKLKYTTGLVLVEYGGAPKGSEAARTAQDSQIQFKDEKYNLDTDWISLSIEAGVRYPKLNPTEIFTAYTMNAKDFDQKFEESVHYSNVYVPANIKEFDLEKYDPHPAWVKAWGYEKTQDMYIHRDDHGEVTTRFHCDNVSPTNWSYQCDMSWSLQPEMRVWAKVTLQRVHLKDWRLIQAQTEKLIKSLVVDPNNLPKASNNSKEIG